MSLPSLPHRPAGANPDESPWKFESEVIALARRSPPRPYPVVCIGSSTFTMWRELNADLGGIGALNHGFGGCEISDCIHYCPLLVIPYAPRFVLLCAGDNDLAGGKDAAETLAQFDAFTWRVWSDLPHAKVLFVAIKPSLARWAFWPAQLVVNETIRQRATTDPRIGFIDIRPVMLTPGQRPRAELFLEDGLHLNAAGYAAWSSVLRPRMAAELDA